MISEIQVRLLPKQGAKFVPIWMAVSSNHEFEPFSPFGLWNWGQCSILSLEDQLDVNNEPIAIARFASSIALIGKILFNAYIIMSYGVAIIEFRSRILLWLLNTLATSISRCRQTTKSPNFETMSCKLKRQWGWTLQLSRNYRSAFSLTNSIKCFVIRRILRELWLALCEVRAVLQRCWSSWPGASVRLPEQETLTRICPGDAVSIEVPYGFENKVILQVVSCWKVQGNQFIVGQQFRSPGDLPDLSRDYWTSDELVLTDVLIIVTKQQIVRKVRVRRFKEKLGKANPDRKYWRDFVSIENKQIEVGRFVYLIW